MIIIKESLKIFAETFKEANYQRGITIAIAVIAPLLVSGYLGSLSVGIAMAFGVFFSSPSDIPGSLHRKVNGIAVSIVIAVSTALLVGYTKDGTYFFLVLPFLFFALSIIAVYGFRASLISFSGLFAAVLSMSSFSSGGSVLLYALTVGLGGIWYLLLSVLIHLLTPRRQTEEFLQQSFVLTASYLRIRTELVQAPPDKQQELHRKLSQVQTELNDKHETMRELLISKRANSGRSQDRRKKLLIFMELVDFLEMGMTNPLNYERMEKLFPEDDEYLAALKEWSFLMAERLEEAGRLVKRGKALVADKALEEFTENLRIRFSSLSTKNPSETNESLLESRNLYHFKEKQYQKIVDIERLLLDIEGERSFGVKRKEAVKFISSQEYTLQQLLDNLDFKSPIFRHSLRLTTVVLMGYIIGNYLHVNNPYWILMTSLVILRPGYGLTRERSKNRTLGTVIGGALGAIFVYFVQDTTVYAVLAIISFILGFALSQKNYKVSAAFITLNVVFIYGLTAPDTFTVIEFRVLDTLLGAGLAFLGNSLLWPTWEYLSINNSIGSSIAANRQYIKEIKVFYLTRKPELTSYKLSRKEAFLALGNLSSAFQRMAQEPKSKQKDFGEIFQVVSLNSELLSSAAALGTFMRTHPTTEPSVHFENLMEAILTNLSVSVNILEKKTPKEPVDSEKVQEAKEYFQNHLLDLVKQKTFGEKNPAEVQNRIQEAQLLKNQLNWLLEISQNLVHLLTKISKK